MVQSIPRPAFNPSAFKVSANKIENALTLVTPQLPFYVEVRTSSLLNFLQEVYNFSNKEAIKSWLFTKQKPEFYFEISEHLHISFADQRDVKGTEYWWIIYYDNSTRRKVIESIKIQQHHVRTKLQNQEIKEQLSWNGLAFRSQTEIKIAKQLYSKHIIFFVNANGFMGLDGMPVSNYDNRQIEKSEIDFLVFHNQKSMILEVDGVHHNETSQRDWDCKTDRVFLRQGIPTVRFSAKQCYENTSGVVDEFLELFK